MASDGRSVLYHVFRLGREVDELLTDALASAPLSPTEYAVYSAVFEAEPVTPKLIGAELGMPPQTVTDWVALLRRRGHLRSEPNPRDGRSVLLGLTAEGRRVHRETAIAFEVVHDDVVRRLPAGSAPSIAALSELIDAVRGARSGSQGRSDQRAGAASTASSTRSRPAK